MTTQITPYLQIEKYMHVEVKGTVEEKEEKISVVARDQGHLNSISQEGTYLLTDVPKPCEPIKRSHS